MDVVVDVGFQFDAKFPAFGGNGVGVICQYQLVFGCLIDEYGVIPGVSAEKDATFPFFRVFVGGNGETDTLGFGGSCFQLFYPCLIVSRDCYPAIDAVFYFNGDVAAFLREVEFVFAEDDGIRRFLGDGHDACFITGFDGEVGVPVCRFGGRGGCDSDGFVAFAGGDVGLTPGTFIGDGPVGVTGDGKFFFPAFGFQCEVGGGEFQGYVFGIDRFIGFVNAFVIASAAHAEGA